MMLTFDERRMIETLNRLPEKLRVLFAALSAERLLPNYVRFHQKTGRGDANRLIQIADGVWQDLEGNEMSDDEIQAVLDECEPLSPAEDVGPWVDGQAYAEDAAAALAYTLRARQSGDPQEAAWAARRAYESIDHFVQISEGASDRSQSFVVDEERVLSHPLMQAELQRQQRDLQELQHLAIIGITRAELARLRASARREGEALFELPA